MGCQCTKHISPVEFFILHGADMIRTEQSTRIGDKLMFTYKTHIFTFYTSPDGVSRLVHEKKGYVSCHAMTEYIDAMNRVVDGRLLMSPPIKKCPHVISCNIWNSEAEPDKKELRFDLNSLPAHVKLQRWKTLHQLCETMDVLLAPISATGHAIAVTDAPNIIQLRQKILHIASLNVKWHDFT